MTHILITKYFRGITMWSAIVPNVLADQKWYTVLKKLHLQSQGYCKCSTEGGVCALLREFREREAFRNNTETELDYNNEREDGVRWSSLNYFIFLLLYIPNVLHPLLLVAMEEGSSVPNPVSGQPLYLFSWFFPSYPHQDSNSAIILSLWIMNFWFSIGPFSQHTKMP